MVTEGMYDDRRASDGAPSTPDGLFGTTLLRLPADIADGLERLTAAVPLWPVGFGEWKAVLAGVRVFATRWHDLAIAHGREPFQLYSLNRHAPCGNLADMGAAFVMARGRYRAVDVDQHGIVVESGSGAQLRFLPQAVSSEAALAWLLVPDKRAPPSARATEGGARA